MENQLISYKTAKLAKEEGFNIDTEKIWVNYYTEFPVNKWKLINREESTLFWCEFPALEQSYLQCWLRDQYKVHIGIVTNKNLWCFMLYKLPSENEILFANSGECQDKDLRLEAELMNEQWFLYRFKTYEEALEDGLYQALLLIKIEKEQQ